MKTKFAKKKDNNSKYMTKFPKEWILDNKVDFFRVFCGVLWHINICRLFNDKFIFRQVISSISNNSVLYD